MAAPEDRTDLIDLSPAHASPSTDSWAARAAAAPATSTCAPSCSGCASTSDATAMTSRRAVLALLLCGTAARAAGIEQLITRPITLPQRSEEHTSNSSHQIISYAVFCLKKKKK